MRGSKKFLLGWFCATAFVPLGLQAQVSVTDDGSAITIGNSYLSRTFNVASGKLTPGNLVNKKISGSMTYTPGTGSEEFTISTASSSAALPTTGIISRTGWAVTTNSWCVDSNTSGSANYAIDGNAATFWHSNYKGTSGTGGSTLPFWIQVDMTASHTVNSVCYVPRQSGDNGVAKGYSIYVSNNASTPGTAVASGTLVTDGTNPIWINLPTAATGRYVRFEITSTQNGSAFGSCAEFYVSEESHAVTASNIAASNLTYTSKTVEDLTGGGKRLTLNFAPYTYKGVDWTIKEVIEMKDADAFMHKYLKINVPAAQRATATIDYIDMERLGTAAVATANKWSRPDQSDIGGGQTGWMAGLGQPIYIDGMYFGSEFPETDNQIVSDVAYTRYYSGKTFQKFGIEKRLDTDGNFTTWPNVIGASSSATDLDIIRTDLFAYINSTIARPSKFRLQYNSWYDWELNITSDRIISSFKEMERGFSQHGLRPVDSYVVDDGWNAYANHSDTQTTPNTSDFWQFNAKFPNGLTESSQFAHAVNSKFGLWLGPRGGYNYPGDWASYLQTKGTGTYNNNSGDIVTGDSVYLSRLQQFFLKCQKDYDINYWKLDGFVVRVPQASTNGRYITGGTNGMYYITEHWERWNNLLDVLYTDAKSRGTDLWINLTCYVNPSPWILRMGNSVWLQASADQSDLGLGRDIKLEKQLNYRDNVYYDVVNTREFQFPISAYFHHDPSFGKIRFDANSANDAQFRMYLYMIAMRGSAFWDMLYSYTNLNVGNKWMINTEALQFAEKYHETLQHAKLFGAQASTGGVYGYSAWNPTTKEGFVALRNPSTSTKSYTLNLTNKIGVPTDAANLYRSLVMEYLSSQTNESNASTYSYGSNITVSLAPGEVRIWKFSTTQDKTAPSFLLAGSDSAANSIKVKFDEPIKATASNFTVSGSTTPAVSKAVIGADYKTVTLTLASALTTDSKYKVIANGVTDWNGNSVTNLASPEFYCNDSAIVATVSAPSALKGTPALGTSTETVVEKDFTMMSFDKAYDLTSTKSVLGKGDFNIAFALKTTTASTTLLSQGSQITVALENGYVKFTVGGLSVTSSVAVNTGVAHFISCCREANGMLKIYVDGVINKSAYDATNVSPAITEGTLSAGGAGVAMGGISIADNAYSYSSQLTLVKNAAAAPKLSNETMSYFYRMYTPNRESRYPTSAGNNADLVGQGTATTTASQWKFQSRTDGTFDIINRADGCYVSPASSYNTALKTTTAQPSAGWKFTATGTDGIFTISSGTVEFNQTQTGLGYKVYNWSSSSDGQDLSDAGCQYAFTFVEGIPTAITTVGATTTPTVTIVNGKVEVSGNANSIVIRTLDGRPVSAPTVPGTYLITVDGKTYKYLVK